MKVSEGDIVILGTDGLFDNLFDEDIIQSIQSTLTEHKGAKDVAQKVAQSIAQTASQVRTKERNSRDTFNTSSRPLTTNEDSLHSPRMLTEYVNAINPLRGTYINCSQ